MKQPAWLWAMTKLMQLLIPIWIIVSSVMIILASAPLWVPLEYRLPGFPEDTYGFTLEERIEWSSVDLRYLLADEDISYFDDYVLDDGSPMHNDRELSHMEDVKQLIELVRMVMFGVGVVLVGAGISLWRREGPESLYRVLRVGAWNTIIFVILLIFGVAVSFRAVFVGFHRIFFEGDTWLFRYSDTFIRLYPERFWRDIFIYTGIVTILQSGLFFLVGRQTPSRS